MNLITSFLEYRLVSNQICSNLGMQSIVDVNDCQNAINVQGINSDKQKSQRTAYEAYGESVEKGCFLSPTEWGNYIRFNAHPRASESTEGSRICRSGIPSCEFLRK